MKKLKLCGLMLGFMLSFSFCVNAQVIMFDDFNYNTINDTELTSFNKWNIINGVSGPPEGGLYQQDNIKFKVDPNNENNQLMTLSTTVNGQTNAITHSRIETRDFEYFEGTYAARVYYSDLPYGYGDANIQTFYTIVGSHLSGDGSKYSELDFEYMASDKWGISANNKVMYLTSWNRYIAEPWQAWKRYWADTKSYEGWHTLVVTCTDGVNVKYYMDGQFITSMSTTDNDGTSVYPRSPMQVAFANWVWNNVIGDSNDTRNTTMEVDWVFFQKDTELSTNQVENLVSNYRSSGLVRQNLLGQKYYKTVNIEGQQPYDGNAALIPGVIEAERYDLGGEGVAFHEVPADGINSGGSNFRTDGVDIQEISSGQYNIGYISPGEWLEYTVDVTSTDVYDIQAVVANGFEPVAYFHLEIDGNRIGNDGVLTYTGPWSTWISLSLGQVSLTQGEHIIRLHADQETFTIDKIMFTKRINTEINRALETSTFNIYPNPVGRMLTIASEEGLLGGCLIFDSKGQQVMNGDLLDNSINVSLLDSGIYFLKFIHDGKVIVKKFIKQ